MGQRTFGPLRELATDNSLPVADKSTSMPRKAAKEQRLYAYFVARPTSCRTPIHSVRSKILCPMGKLDKKCHEW
jgi:hypothetical protein